MKSFQKAVLEAEGTMEDGKWKLETGIWKMEDREWKIEDWK